MFYLLFSKRTFFLVLLFCFFSPLKVCSGSIMPSAGWYWPTGSGDFCGYLGWLGYNSGWGYHLAQDMCNGEGQDIYSIGDGEIIAAQESNGYGCNGSCTGGTVLIRHQANDGTYFTALYGHLDNYLTSGTVSAGQVIGQTLPDWSPPHLHFAIHPGYNPEPDNPWRGYTTDSNNTYGFIDPIPFLNAHSRSTNEHKAIAPILSLLLFGSTYATVPTLLDPANGSNLSTICPLYQWDSGSDPDATQSRLEIARDSNFTQPVASLRHWKSTGQVSFRFSSNLTPDTTYYWRAYLMYGDTQGPYSDVWSFTTGFGGTILSAPALIAPANGSTLTSSPVILQWTSVSGASEYLVRWRKVGTLGYSYSWVNGTEYSIGWLDPDTEYEWWVSARNDYAVGEDSEIWQFTTLATSSLMESQSVQNIPPDGFVKSVVYERGKLYNSIEPRAITRGQ